MTFLDELDALVERRHPGARYVLDLAAPQHPTVEETDAGMGSAECLSRVGRFEDAAAEVRAAIGLGLNTFECRVLLATVLSAQGMRSLRGHNAKEIPLASHKAWSEAVEEFEYAMGLRPDDWTAPDRAARLLMLLSEPGRAVLLLRVVVQRNPDAREARQLLNALEARRPGEFGLGSVE